MVALPSMTAFTKSFDTHRKSVGAEMLRTVMLGCLVGVWMLCLGVLYREICCGGRRGGVDAGVVRRGEESDGKSGCERERKCTRVANACQVPMNLPTAVAPKKDATDELLLLMMPREQERMDHEEESVAMSSKTVRHRARLCRMCCVAIERAPPALGIRL